MSVFAGSEKGLADTAQGVTRQHEIPRAQGSSERHVRRVLVQYKMSLQGEGLVHYCPLVDPPNYYVRQSLVRHRYAPPRRDLLGIMFLCTTFKALRKSR